MIEIVQNSTTIGSIINLFARGKKLAAAQVGAVPRRCCSRAAGPH